MMKMKSFAWVEEKSEPNEIVNTLGWRSQSIAVDLSSVDLSDS